MNSNPQPLDEQLDGEFVDSLVHSEGFFSYVISGHGASIVGRSSSVGNLCQESENGCDTLLEIPPSLGGLPLVDIQMGALSFSRLTPHVNIPNSVVSIGEGALSRTTMESLYLPASVASIGDDAFSYTSNLRSIEVDPANPIFCVVDHSLIRRMQRQELLRFASSEQEVHYRVPRGVIIIGCRSFSDCKNLVSITMDADVHHINEAAFYNCTSLLSVRLSQGIWSKGIWDIGDRAFWRCKSLASVEIPPSVSFIGKDAFCDCSPDLVLTVTEGSYAERWAMENGVAYKTL